MFEQIIPLIQQIADDRTVPRNIRDKCAAAVKTLNDNSIELSVRINTVISDLDEVANDPNIPMYTRTQVWNIVTALEAISKDQSKNI
ncbi:MAG: UPF0147 family protein [Candidatus Aenigmatarchaeota archaeon]|nr:UPF0147 family protein [Candidatus Aenigmarchaeota archaeon]